MNLTQIQKELLEENGINITDDINDLLLDLDAKITEIGFDKNYNLNSVGLELQKLYDQIYYQNSLRRRRLNR